jgi:hypothetical protein
VPEDFCIVCATGLSATSVYNHAYMLRRAGALPASTALSVHHSLREILLEITHGPVDRR